MSKPLLHDYVGDISDGSHSDDASSTIAPSSPARSPSPEPRRSDGLPPPGLRSDGLTPWVIFSNLSMQILASTILGIGSKMKSGGWILTPIVICFGGLIIGEMIRLVSVTMDAARCRNGLEARAYQDFVTAALGKRGSRLATTTSICDLLLCMCVSFVLCSQNLQVIAPISWPWFGVEDEGRKWWTVFLCLTTLVVVFIELAPLAKVAAVVAPALNVVCVVLALYGSATVAVEVREFPLSCRDSDDTTYWSWAPDSLSAGIVQTSSIAAYSFYCFAVVVSIPSLKSEMAEPSKLPRAANGSIRLTSFLFCALMLCSYSGFGNLGPENLVDAMRSNRPLGWWAMTNPWSTGTSTLTGKALSFLIVVNALLTDAVWVPCAIRGIEGIAPGFFRERRWSIVMRLCLVLFRFLVASNVTSFVVLCEFSSSLFCVCNNVLLPIAAFYGMGAEKVGTGRKSVHALIFIFGLIIVVCGTTTAAMTLFSPKPQHVKSVTTLRPGISYTCAEAYHNATSS